MRKTYHFLRSFIFAVLAALVFVAFFGVIAFSFMHNEDTRTLEWPHIITIMFYMLISASCALSIVMAIKSKDVQLTKIKKSNPFLLFSSAFAAIIALVFFVYECVVSIARSYIGVYFILRTARWILLLFVVAYFVFQAMPNKVKRVNISIPLAARATASIGAVIWAVLSILVVYFNNLGATDISKISMLLVYASFAVFFVFEGIFELIKARIIPYIISAGISATLAFAFPLGISISKIIGTYDSSFGFSQSEMLMCFAIGLYCLARMVAYVWTMRRVIELSARESHSSKFDKKSSVSQSEKKG